MFGLRMVPGRYAAWVNGGARARNGRVNPSEPCEITQREFTTP
jgi:hypothetical protein